MNRRQKAMTLIEVMVAILLVFFMSFISSRMFHFIAKTELMNEARTEAVGLAENQIESIQKNITTAEDFNILTGSADYILSTNPNYVYKTSVSQSTSGLKFVTVDICYRDVSQSQPLPNLSKPNNGRVLSVGSYVSKP